MKKLTPEQKKEYAIQKQAEIRQKMNELVEHLSNAETVSGFIETVFRYPDNIPAKNWSFGNRFGLFIYNSIDARGYRQWQEANRRVKKGSCALSILVPLVKKYEVEMKDSAGHLVFDAQGNIRTEQKTGVYSYKLVPVFDVKDTEGEDLKYMAQLNEFDYSDFPLLDVAAHIGVKIKKDISRGGYFAYYRPAAKEITLCSDGEQTFLHEICHALDHKINPAEFRNSGDSGALQEIVAEFTACFLARQYGKQARLNETKTYLEKFAGKNANIAQAVEKVFARCFNIIEYIMKFKGRAAVA